MGSVSARWRSVGATGAEASARTSSGSDGGVPRPFGAMPCADSARRRFGMLSYAASARRLLRRLLSLLEGRMDVLMDQEEIDALQDEMLSPSVFYTAMFGAPTVYTNTPQRGGTRRGDAPIRKSGINSR